MITDEALRAAAAKSSAVYIRYVEQGFDPKHQHVFSLKFEKQLKRISRRARHPFLYPAIQRIASFLLAILIGGTVWLSVDTNARAAFLGWVKEFYETYIVYRFDTNHPRNITEIYRPTWLPEGYQEIYSDYSGNTAEIRYMNTTDQGLIFGYSINSTSVDWFIQDVLFFIICLLLQYSNVLRRSNRLCPLGFDFCYNPPYYLKYDEKR